MTNFIRTTSLAATATALALAATPALAVTGPTTVGPTDKQATATVHVVKPLTMTWKRDLSLGSIVTEAGTWTGESVSLGADGVFDCTAADLTCSGTHQTAQYTVTGSPSEVVTINSPATLTLTDATSDTLTMTVAKLDKVTLGTDGSKVINLGGAVTLNNNTPAGVYTGTFAVTVNY